MSEIVVLQKFTLMPGEAYDGYFLLPRETHILLLDERIDYDYCEIERAFPNYVITHPVTVYTPFSKQEMDCALEEYISIYTDAAGVLDLSGIILLPGDTLDILIETIESDWLYGSGKKVRYPSGKIVQL